ncbi:MAG: 50S ribosome-binding GTPase [Chloroflexi bacterium]|nr:50S ribosome-binding GTPase [Chloroflexota bacterium]
MTEPLDADALTARVGMLDDLARRSWSLVADHERALGRDPEAPASPSDTPGPRQRARELLDHVEGYLAPRARDLDAPLLVVLIGPTGSGKSTITNTLAGSLVSEPGVLRPTTRHAVVVAAPPDHAWATGADGPLAAIPAERLRHTSTGARPGIVLVDAPDIDSVEHDNRALADALLERSDLCLFVTTATRYADRVPWDVLARIAERGMPLLVVVNRMPPDASDQEHVLADVRAMLERAAIPVEVVLGIPEGALAADGPGLTGAAAASLTTRLDTLAADRDARRALAARALAGALAGIAPLATSIAADLETLAEDADRLRLRAVEDHAQELVLLLERVNGGDVLRGEVVAQWHSFVGADQVTRWFSSGIGRVRAALTTLVRGAPPAPVTAVERGVTDDLASLVVATADDAARRTADHWSADPDGMALLADHPALWAASPDLRERAALSLREWMASIASDVAATGATKRGVARGLSLGVNAGAVTIMLGVFAHTGGITGAEAGIAAATAYLNQKLMNALFGEAAVQEMIDHARDDLADRLRTLLDEERRRFDRLLPTVDTVRALSAELRAVA